MSDIAPPLPESRPVRRSPARPLAGFGPVFVWGLRRVVRWKKVAVVGTVAVSLGGLLGWQLGQATDVPRAVARAFDRGLLTIGLPLIALLLVAEGFAFERQARTLVFHLVRPVSRATIFVARFFSGLIPAALVGTAFLSAVVLGSGVPFTSGAWLSLPVTATLASLALGAIYYTLAALLRHGLIAGLIYTFVVEAMISSVPGSMQTFSVMHHVRSVHHRLTESVLPYIRPLGRRNPLVGGADQVADSTPGEAVVVLLVITVAVLAFGVWRVGRRDFALKD